MTTLCSALHPICSQGFPNVFASTQKVDKCLAKTALPYCFFSDVLCLKFIQDFSSLPNTYIRKLKIIPWPWPHAEAKTQRTQSINFKLKDALRCIAYSMELLFSIAPVWHDNVIPMKNLHPVLKTESCVTVKVQLPLRYATVWIDSMTKWLLHTDFPTSTAAPDKQHLHWSSHRRQKLLCNSCWCCGLVQGSSLLAPC